MATKQPTLKALKAELLELTKKVTELEKSLAYEKGQKDYYSKRDSEAREEIEQVHALLDALPGSGPRKTEDENSWNRKDLKTMTRLAAYLANRAGV